MGSRLTDDPIYLPSFFDRVLTSRGNESTVFLVRPLYRNLSALDAARRYFATFGFAAASQLAWRILGAKIRRRTIARICERHGVPLALDRLPSRGCLNIHDAILPEYRDVMPSFWMLANGEKRAGVSIFFVNEDIDAGELCGQHTFEIRADETLDEFLRRSKAIPRNYCSTFWRRSRRAWFPESRSTSARARTTHGRTACATFSRRLPARLNG